MKLIVYQRIILIVPMINCFGQIHTCTVDLAEPGVSRQSCVEQGLDCSNIQNKYHDYDYDHSYFHPNEDPYHYVQPCDLNYNSYLNLHLPENEDCFTVFDGCGCNCKRKNAYLQFYNVSGHNKVLELNGEGRLLNFNISPGSYQLCDNTLDMGKEPCKSQVDLEIYNRMNTKKASGEGLITINNTKCENLSGRQARILNDAKGPVLMLKNISKKNLTTCLEVFSEIDCTGDMVRVVVTPESFSGSSDKDKTSFRIWEYLNDKNRNPIVDTDIKSIKICSHCLKDAEPTPSPGINAVASDDVPQVSSKTPVAAANTHTNLPDKKNCKFQSCMRIPAFLDDKSMPQHKCYLYFGDTNCSTGLTVTKTLNNITELQSIVGDYPTIKKWSTAPCSGNEENPPKCLKPKFSSFQEAFHSSTPPIQPTHTVEIIVLSVAGSLAFIMLILVIIMAALLWRKKRRIRAIMHARCFPHTRAGQQQRNLNMHQIDSIEVNDYVNDITGLRSLCASFTGAFEIPRDQINIGNIRDNTACIIGVGEISIAFKGRLEPHGKTVAVKTLKSGQGTTRSIKAVLKEAQMFMQLGSHPGILELVGVCTENVRQGEVFVVMTWCQNGPLRGFLAQQKNHFESLVQDGEWVTGQKIQQALESKSSLEKGPPVKFNTIQLFKWCYQVVDAMEFLAVRKIIHITLSSRNVLLDENFTCKISDFHLAKVCGDGIPSESFNSMSSTTATLNRERVIPWRWCAVESLLDDVFSTQSDVWTFGVFMWEVFSLGAIPYPEYSYGSEFTLCIKHGYRLQTPEFAPIECYQLMLMCWYDAPEKRPSFSKLKFKLKEMTPDKNRCSSVGSFQTVRL